MTRGLIPRVIHLASGNAHKAEELQALADGSPAGGLRRIRIVPAARMPEVAEDTGTFAGNARKKAAALQARLGPEAWVLADDSGVCVDALGGAPGVESAYFAGPQHDLRANLAKLTEVMRGVPPEKRGAHFVCVLLVRGPGGVELVAEGRCPGRLLDEPRGSGGFGYDPLFVPEGFDRTYAELTEGEKNRISHRARAWARVAEWLRARDA